jgi:hypothetical protein
MELPKVEVSESETSMIMERVNAFTNAIKNNTSPSPLVLTSRDINVLIANHPDWRELAGKVYVSIEDDRVKGQISILLNEFGGMFEGRYLNGSAIFSVSMTSERFLVFLDSAEVAGEPLPDELMKGMRAENLAAESNKDPDVIAIIEKLE